MNNKRVVLIIIVLTLLGSTNVNAFIPNGVTIGTTTTLSSILSTCFDGVYHYLLYANNTHALKYAWATDPRTTGGWHINNLIPTPSGWERHGVVTYCDPARGQGFTIAYAEGDTMVNNGFTIIYHRFILGSSLSTASIDGKFAPFNIGSFGLWRMSSVLSMNDGTWVSVVRESSAGCCSEGDVSVIHNGTVSFNSHSSPFTASFVTQLLALNGPDQLVHPTFFYSNNAIVYATAFNGVFWSSSVSGLSGEFLGAVAPFGAINADVISQRCVVSSGCSFFLDTAQYQAPANTWINVVSPVTSSDHVVGISLVWDTAHQVPIFYWLGFNFDISHQMIDYNYPRNETNWGSGSGVPHVAYFTNGDEINPSAGVVIPKNLETHGFEVIYDVTSTVPDTIKWNMLNVTYITLVGNPVVIVRHVRGTVTEINNLSPAMLLNLAIILMLVGFAVGLIRVMRGLEGQSESNIVRANKQRLIVRPHKYETKTWT